MLKKYIQNRLEKYVKQYFEKHPEVKLVAVAGSVGKTSTKTAIATVLSTAYRVRLHEGNHNTPMSAPLAILGIDYPGRVKSPLAWWSVFRAARRRIKAPTDVDVIIQELGIDRPGEMAEFARYLRPDVGVVTAVTAEHMEFFGTLDAVAAEELSIASFSQAVIINRDDIDGQYASYITNPNLTTYGTSASAEYHFIASGFTIESGHSGNLVTPSLPEGFAVNVQVLGEHNLRPAIGAAAVGAVLGLTNEQIAAGLAGVRPVPGRMNPLPGVRGSLIIDDSYNSSPLAAESALQTLYSLQAPQRVAILGSMNELGTASAEEHRRLGELCDPSLLEWVVTVGKDAAEYLAPAAKSRGCQVASFMSAIEAGGFVHKVLDDGAVVLGKGSQGDIYVEEALKILLHDSSDVDQLVRQSPSWRKRKDRFFSKFS